MVKIARVFSSKALLRLFVGSFSSNSYYVSFTRPHISYSKHSIMSFCDRITHLETKVTDRQESVNWLGTLHWLA